MRIVLFKDSETSFLQALEGAGIPYERSTPMPGQVMASGSIIAIAQAVTAAAPVAAVLVAWIRARASRKIILTLSTNKVIHLEGYSVEQAQELLLTTTQLAAIDTKSTAQPETLMPPPSTN